jgi:hypothetical protein
MILLKERKEELEILIAAWSRMKSRGELSLLGLNYLAGLERAYNILFPVRISK